MVDISDPKSCDPNTLEVGDWLSGTVYYKVLLNTSDIGKLKLIDNYGRTLWVSNGILQREMTSSKQHEEEKEVSRTEMVRILTQAKDQVFTARFKKQITGKRLFEVLDQADAEEEYAQQSISKKKKTLAKALKGGEERELVGYLKNTEALLGRSTVIDLNIPRDQSGIRLIDHRSLQELTINGVKYMLK